MMRHYCHTRLFVFSLSLETSVRWIKVHKTGQQGHITLQGSHAAIIGELHEEGVIEYLHTRAAGRH